MKLCDIYKLISDGIGSREEKVQKACLNYLRGNLNMFQPRVQRIGGLSTDKDGRIEAELQQQIRIEILRFLQVFQLEKALPYPDLLKQINNMMEMILIEIIPEEEIVLYLKYILTRLSHQNMFEDIQQDEIYFLRTLAYLAYSNS